MIPQTKPKLVGGLWPSPLLERVMTVCPHAKVVRESERWSRRAAARVGRCRIFGPADLQNEALPFDPANVTVQITWTPIRRTATVAWVATWPKHD